MKNTYFHLTEQSFEFPQNGFELKNGFLTFHNVSLEHLIKKHGTPFRLFYLPNIAEKIKQARDLFNKAFKKHHYLGKYQYCYCTKSNHFSHTVSAALKENIHLETSSSFDIDLILNLLKIYYQKLKKSRQTSIGSIKIGRQIKEPSIHIAVPIYQHSTGFKEDLRGFLVGGISPELIGRIIDRSLADNKHYRGLLIDEKTRIAHDGHHERALMTELSATDPLRSCKTEPIDALIDGVLSRAYCKKLKVPGLDWTLWITIPMTTLNAASAQATWLLIEDFILVILAIGLLALLLSFKVHSLTRSMKRVSQQIMQNNMNISMPQVHWYTPKEISLMTDLAQQTIDYFEHSRELALEKEKTLHLFGKHVDKEVAKHLLDKSVHAETKEVTVLFTDLRGFTSLSEQVDPDTLLDLLNQHFNTIVPVIHHFGGTLNKFIGDAIMATFGAPLELEDHALKACLAAQGMIQAMDELNIHLHAQGLPQLKMGIGISTGSAILGLLGTNERQEYAVMGDTVNTAARLEGLNSSLATSILISEMTYSLVQHKFKTNSMGSIELKGKAEPLAVYTII